MKSVRTFKIFWRAQGAKIILVCQLISMFINPVIFGLVTLSVVTVPCGIKQVNRNWWLWYPRQIFFAAMGILSILNGLH